MSEPLSNDQKIELMKLAHSKGHADFTKDYALMVDMIAETQPEEKPKKD